MTEKKEKPNANRSTLPGTDEFLAYIASQWAERVDELPAAAEVAPYAAARRQKLGAEFPGKRLVLAAGDLQWRSNDTAYQFRAHSAFSHMTGWGSQAEPGSVLVLEPLPAGSAETHTATLYFRERAGRDSEEFFENAEIGEFWVGPRPSLAQVSALLGIATKHIDEFVPQEDDVTLADEELARVCSELRLVKDAYEIAELKAAVAATGQGFSEVLASLPQAQQHPRGERMVEGVFNTRARLDGNAVGYETIAAAGPHACILHWIHNDGPVRAGDLLLLDAGVEMDSLYTADITRTVPINGKFTAVQRMIYETVLEAADAAFAVVRPGIRFHEVHDAAMEVIERRTREWGLLPADNKLTYHRRYMVHGTSHHLGIDVHDCAKARAEMYKFGIVEEGMVFTIEPGLYFQPDDLTVPEEMRGIGVRIEDDVLVTSDGCINLSAAIPRTADAVEEWIARVQNK